MEKVETISGLALVRASKRARQLGLDGYLDQDTERLIDLAGVNVLRLRLPHNDRRGSSRDENEWRCVILAKFKDREGPQEVIVDIPTEDLNNYVMVIDNEVRIDLGGPA
jgi:hypothetical protein